MQLKARAPGSLMLLGEYGVLQDKKAIVCAIDKRISVLMTPRSDRRIHLSSQQLGQYSTDLASLSPVRPFQFVLSAIKQYRRQLTSGFDLDIHSEFSPHLGLGSSAAVTAATLAVLMQWLGKPLDLLTLVRTGRKAIREVQGLGSGADLAASVYGGIISYTAGPLAVEKFAGAHPLTAWYSGHKVPTPEAIQRVHKSFAHAPLLFRRLCESIGACAEEGAKRLREQDWQGFAELMTIQQGLMEALGVSSPILRSMIASLRLQPGILGAKISGAGFGDCVIGFGESRQTVIAHHEQGACPVPVAMALQGVECEQVCDNGP